MLNTAASRRLQPLVALGAFRKLLKDPDDTHQVFMIGEALRGNSLARVTNRFRDTSVGRAILQGHQALMPLLTDRAALAALPAGSLGRSYLDFVVSENLSAQGLAEAARKRDEMSRVTPDEHVFRSHLRDSHDLWHVLTGYGRDPLGELCLLAFTHAQTRLNGIGAIAFLGALRAMRSLPGQPARSAVLEGRRTGRNAQWLLAVDWEPLMRQDLARTREQLGITSPVLYRQILAASSLKLANA